MAEKWTHLISVPSDTSRGTAYGLDVNEDGTIIRCRCASYIHSQMRPKTCKHIEKPSVGVALRAYLKKNGLLPLGGYKLGKIAVVTPDWRNRYVSLPFGTTASEQCVLVTARELRQAETVIEEATRVLGLKYRLDSRSLDRLQESIDDLGRA